MALRKFSLTLFGTAEKESERIKGNPKKKTFGNAGAREKFYNSLAKLFHFNEFFCLVFGFRVK